MKVITNWYQTSIAFHDSTFQEGIKCNVNKCGFLLMLSSVETNFVFSMVTSLILP